MRYLRGPNLVDAVSSWTNCPLSRREALKDANNDSIHTVGGWHWVPAVRWLATAAWRLYRIAAESSLRLSSNASAFQVDSDCRGTNSKNGQKQSTWLGPTRSAIVSLLAHDATQRRRQRPAV